MLCAAEEAKLGSYIVARGAVVGCETWTDRILDIVEIKADENPTILNLPDLEILGLNGADIETVVLDRIEQQTGIRPQTISIEIIDSESEYKSLINEYAFSLTRLIQKRCPKQRKPPLDNMEEQIEKIRRVELIKSVA